VIDVFVDILPKNGEVGNLYFFDIELGIQNLFQNSSPFSPSLGGNKRTFSKKDPRLSWEVMEIPDRPRKNSMYTEFQTEGGIAASYPRSVAESAQSAPDFQC